MVKTAYDGMRSHIGTLVLALVIVTTMLSANVAHAQSYSSLSFGSVTPPSSDLTNMFTYSVTYTDTNDTPPLTVTVSIDGIAYNMQAENDTDVNYLDGKTYTYSTMLTIGTHTYMFTATTTNGTVSYPPNGLPMSGPTVTDGGIASYTACCTGVTIATGLAIVLGAVVLVLVGIYLLKRKKGAQNLQPNQQGQIAQIGQYGQYQQPYGQYPQQPQQQGPNPPPQDYNAYAPNAGQPTQPIAQQTQLAQQITLEPKAQPTSSSKREKCQNKSECFMCRGDIWPGDMMVSCRCGKDFHDSCASAVGECPACGKKV